MTKRALLVAILPVVALWGCDSTDMIHEPEWTLSRMLDQPRYNPYAPSSFFADGRAMRKPVAGTVPRDAVLGAPLFMDGYEGGTYATTVPMPVTRALLEEGHDQFEVVCATCHGALGDGNSLVSAKMQIRKPPSLLTPDIASFPPGRVYRIVTVGYGLMPAVDYQLDVRQRWAVVAYLKALQRSQVALVVDLPPALRDQLAGTLP
jgi:mono/diheme cytochrome c family protein